MRKKGIMKILIKPLIMITSVFYLSSTSYALPPKLQSIFEIFKGDYIGFTPATSDSNCKIEIRNAIPEQNNYNNYYIDFGYPGAQGRIFLKDDSSFNVFSKTSDTIKFSTKNPGTPRYGEAHGILSIYNGKITGYKLSVKGYDSVNNSVSKPIVVECNNLRVLDSNCTWCGDNY